MSRLHLVLGDQLSMSISSLSDYNPDSDVVLLCEVWNEATYVKHHKKKIAFLFSAMRHFAHHLTQAGYRVLYTTLDDPHNAGTFKGEVERVLKCHKLDSVVVTHPGEYRVLADMQQWQETLGVAVDIRDDNRFFCSITSFEQWAHGRKQLRMEYFYRDMRKQQGILMDEGKPIGGRWNFDAENRKPPREGLNIPAPLSSPVDAITRSVLTLVEQRFDDHFGDLEPFYFAVTREQALQVLRVFIEERLEYFGDYQDAMIEDEAWMYHSHISFYLNCGLLLPMECVHAAEAAFHQGRAPLNAVEGFIRQILGWREYVRGIYWLKMPGYAQLNQLKAKRKLPAFYWTANTRMNCLKQCVTETKKMLMLIIFNA